MSEYISKEDINRVLLERIGANKSCVIKAIELGLHETKQYFNNLLFEDGQIASLIEGLPSASFPDSAENKGDLISRQSALDELEKWDWQELYLPIHFKQILDDVPSVENKRVWIPVSERLPEEDTDVIYCTADGETGYCHYYRGFNSTAYIFNNYPDTAERIMYKNVVAWLPIPEPYKKGE